MNDLLEQLFQKGLITGQEYRKRKALNELKSEKGGDNRRRRVVSFDLDKLNDAGSVRKFKEIAKEILLQNSSLIQEIIKQAHSLKDKDGGKKLIWQLYQLRDLLGHTSPDEHEQIIKKAFRKSGATFELPE